MEFLALSSSNKMEEKASKKSKSASSPLRVLITGAAGQIAYSLIPLVASGATFGADQQIILHLLDIGPMEKALKGVVMEIEDCAYPLVQEVIATIDVNTAFAGVNVAILLGGFPRKPGMERADLLYKNSPIFVEQGKALNNADRDCKVLVVANPANTNCMIAANNSTLPKQNFSCLTRLDQNRAVGLAAGKLGATAGNVKNMIIWGNHSNTQYPDASQSYVQGASGKTSVPSKLDAKYLQTEFVSTIQERGAKVLEVRGLSSAMSAAKAVRDHLHDGSLAHPRGNLCRWACGPMAHTASRKIWCSLSRSLVPKANLALSMAFRGLMRRAWVSRKRRQNWLRSDKSSSRESPLRSRPISLQTEN